MMGVVRVAITGASGFVGRRLASALESAGDEVRAVSIRGEIPAGSFEGCDAVVNLAGESIAQRWTQEVRERIRRSRVEGTRAVVEAMMGVTPRPRVLVNASAVGYYGSRGDEELTEDSAPGGDFLARMAVEWEREAVRFEGRVVRLRIAMVIGRGGAIKKMLPAFRAGVGGRIGDGRQWVSWIHVDDLVSLIRFAIANPGVSGAINASSPEPVRNADFTRELARAVHRPAIVPVPKIALRILFGEMAEVVLLASQRMAPMAAHAAGFGFRFPNLGGALREAVS
jgi:uncharacterized protein